LAIFTALLVCGALVFMQWAGAGTSAVRVPIAGSVVLLSDGVTIEYSDPDTLCRTASLAAAQTRSEVTLSLRESDEPSPCSFGFVSSQVTPVPPLDPAAAILPDFTSTTGSLAAVRLASPLHGRRLVDACTGKALPYFDQVRALRPVLAPSRWRPVFETSGVSSDVPYFGGPGAAVLGDNFIGFDPQTNQPNGWSLTIVQVAGGGWHPPPGTMTRHVIVRGHHGLAAAGIIVWTEAGHTVAVIGQGPARQLPGGAATLGRTPMPFARLLAIAGTLERGA